MILIWLLNLVGIKLQIVLNQLFYTDSHSHQI